MTSSRSRPSPLPEGGGDRGAASWRGPGGRARGAHGSSAAPRGLLSRLWLRWQELPEQLSARHSADREDRLEAARTALRPTWDLRLVPVALSAWGASLLGTAQAGAVGVALETVLERGMPGIMVLAAFLVAVALAGGAALARRGRRRLPTTAESRASRGRRTDALLPTLGLCAVVVLCILLRVGTQQLAAVEDMTALGDQPQRLVVEVADRPVTWHGAAASGFGPGPEELGEASSGVVVPVRLDSGAQATVFAQDDRWARLRSGERVEAVLSAPQLEQTDLQLRSTGPPHRVPPAQQQRPSALEAATQRFALAAQTRGPDAAGLLPGMTYGDRSGLDTGLEEAMKVTGLTHLTAVSGDIVTQGDG